MDEKEIIAKNLAFYRKKAGISQLALAKKLHYSNKNISKWENGETTPNIFILKDIANLYGVSVDDLIKDNKDEQVFANNSTRKLSSFKKTFFRLFWLLLANAIIFSVASVVIYILSFCNLHGFNRWLLYLYFLPLNFLSITIYLRVLYKFVDYITISLIGWILCLSIFLTFKNLTNISYVFLLGGAYQLLVICIATLVNVKLRSKIKKL